MSSAFERQFRRLDAKTQRREGARAVANHRRPEGRGTPRRARHRLRGPPTRPTPREAAIANTSATGPRALDIRDGGFSWRAGGAKSMRGLCAFASLRRDGSYLHSHGWISFMAHSCKVSWTEVYSGPFKGGPRGNPCQGSRRALHRVRGARYAPGVRRKGKTKNENE